MKKKILCIILAVACVLSACAGANKGAKLENITEGKKPDTFECTYEGDKHTFIVYLPEETKDNMPLIIMLHPYAGNPASFRTMTHMEQVACPRGYAVVYAGSKDAEWNSGMGNLTRDDAGFIKALTKYIQDEYGCDKERTFVAGFSNGAFMTQYLAMEAQDTFAAVATVAGLMPGNVWNNKKTTCDIGVLTIYGTSDDLIPMKLTGSYKTSPHPAIEDVVEYWASSNGLTSSSSENLSEKSVLTKYSGDSSKKEVWNVVIDEGRHSWPDETYAGFNTNELVLEFFEENTK